MKALELAAYGDTSHLRLVERSEPIPGPGEVQIRVRAAGLNPIDFKTRNGAVKLLLPRRLPFVLGNELVGVVTQLGEGVVNINVGQRVAARVDKNRTGAFAGVCCVAAELCANVPDAVSDAEAAALPLAGLTAWQCLTEVLQVKAGQRILIHAGAGGVGHLAIQLARALGCDVYATASPSKHALLTSLGAIPIDYRSQRFEDVVTQLDAVLDTQGGDILLRSLGHVRTGGSVVTIGGIPTPEVALEFKRPRWLAWIFAWLTRRERALAAKRGLRFRYWFMRPDGKQLTSLLERVAQGSLRVQVEQSYPLSDFAAAFARLESGNVTGKLVFTC